MKILNKLTLAGVVASAVVLSGCGGSSGGSTGASTVSGTASAPGGVVASFEPQPFYQQALDFLVTPLAAAITGLEPVKGALVELIRVDDNGQQVGDVLATTSTSITGDYQLTLPQGVNLAGNLVVRITGSGQTLRAQVVEQDVDINPVSEFVLRKFIETGADLDQLEVTDVVKLSGRAEQFDLTAGADLDAMFAALENEIGGFIETEIAAVTSEGASTAGLTGEYISMAFEWMLHDNIDGNTATLAHDIWQDNFTITGNSSSSLGINYKGGESAWSNLTLFNAGSPDLYYVTDIDNENENFTGKYTASGLLSVDGEFEENIEQGSGFGWRWPAMTYTFQQVADKGLFIGLSHEAGVRYKMVDTDGDGLTDALDPNQKSGDEVGRVLEMIYRRPTSLTDADMAGSFGRVYLGSRVDAGTIELESEVNTLTADSSFNVTVPAVTAKRLSLDLNTKDLTSTTLPVTGETVDLDVSATGEITENGASGVIGYVNDDATMAIFLDAEGCNDEFEACSPGEFASFEHTTLLRLPTSTPNLSGRKYRVMSLSLSPGGLAVSASKFNTFLTFTNNTSATLTGSFSDLYFSNGFSGVLASESYPTAEVGDSLTVSVQTNGQTLLTLVDSATEQAELEGYFNADASMGAFIFGYKEGANTQDEKYTELGMVMLIDVTAP